MLGLDWAQLAGLVAVLGGVGYFVRRWIAVPLLRLIHQLDEFLDDWRGVPDRPGVPGRPGVMAELHQVRADMDSMRGTVDQLVADREKAHSEALEMWAAIKAVAQSEPPRPATP